MGYGVIPESLIGKVSGFGFLCSIGWIWWLPCAALYYWGIDPLPYCPISSVPGYCEVYGTSLNPFSLLTVSWLSVLLLSSWGAYCCSLTLSWSSLVGAAGCFVTFYSLTLFLSCCFFFLFCANEPSFWVYG